MLRILSLALCAFLLLSSCEKPPGNGQDPNQQVGNPNAHPEKGAKVNSSGEPADNKAGRDPHTGGQSAPR